MKDNKGKYSISKDSKRELRDSDKIKNAVNKDDGVAHLIKLVEDENYNETAEDLGTGYDIYRDINEENLYDFIGKSMDNLEITRPLERIKAEDKRDVLDEDEIVSKSDGKKNEKPQKKGLNEKKESNKESEKKDSSEEQKYFDEKLDSKNTKESKLKRDREKFEEKKKRKGKQSFVRSMNAAVEGIMYTFKSERNMKFHYLASFVVLIAALFFDFNKIEFVLLLGAITLVVIAEMVNTAVEKVVDMVTQEFNPLAKIAKDVAAGAVLVSAMYAVVVAYILFYNKLNTLNGKLVYRIRESELHITIICIVVVLIAVVVVKAITSTGTPMKGGMPSGHSALAFAIATFITLLTERVEASSLAYILALLVAQSRIEGKIHTFWETMAGAMLGTLIAILIFQLGLFY